MKHIDNVNRQILNILQEQGSITNSELAAKVGMAPPTVLERVKKLERLGVIKKYVALVDEQKIGRGIIAFVSISVADHSSQAIKNFNKEIHNLNQVLECYHITGEKDYLLKVIVKDIPAYEAFALDKLAALPNIGKISTMFVLSAIKQDTKIEIEEGDSLIRQ